MVCVCCKSHLKKVPPMGLEPTTPRRRPDTCSYQAELPGALSLNDPYDLGRRRRPCAATLGSGGRLWRCGEDVNGWRECTRQTLLFHQSDVFAKCVKGVVTRAQAFDCKRMPNSIILHLPIRDPDLHAFLAARALKPAHDFAAFSLVRVPSHVLPNALRDLNSREALCAQSDEILSPQFLRSIRWAVHKRFSDVEETHAQLRCDIVGGDESRLKKKKRSGRKRM